MEHCDDSALEFIVNLQPWCLDFYTLLEMEAVMNNSNYHTPDKAIGNDFFNRYGNDFRNKAKDMISTRSVRSKPSRGSIMDGIIREAIKELEEMLNNNNYFAQDKAIGEDVFNGKIKEHINEAKDMIPTQSVLLQSSKLSIDDIIREALENYDHDHNYCMNNSNPLLDGDPYVSDFTEVSNMVDELITGFCEFDNMSEIELLNISKKHSKAIEDLLEVLKFDEDFVPSTLLGLRQEWRRTVDELRSEKAKHSLTKKKLKRVQDSLKVLKKSCSKFNIFMADNVNQGQFMNQKLGEPVPDETILEEEKLLIDEKTEPEFGDDCDAGPGFDIQNELKEFIEENGLDIENVTPKGKNSKLAKKIKILYFRRKSATNFKSSISKILLSFLNGIITTDVVLPILEELQCEVMEYLPYSALRKISDHVRHCRAPKEKIHPFALKIRERWLYSRRQLVKECKARKKMKSEN